MEACLSIKFAYLEWLTCKKCLLGGHGKARRTVKVAYFVQFPAFVTIKNLSKQPER